MTTTTRTTRRTIRLAPPPALVALLFAALAACGGSSPGEDSASKPEPVEEATSSDETSGAFPRTVAHAMGETTIAKRPERVVVLDTPEAGAATLVGVTPVAAVSVDPVNKTYPAHLRQELQGVPDVGPLDEPNIDKIVALRPDLILSSKVRHEDIFERLSQIAPTVFAESPGAGWKENVGLFGRALGREKEASAAVRAYEERARRIGQAVIAKGNGTTPTVSVVRFVDGPTRLYQPSSFSGVVIADTGLARPPSQQDPTAVIKEIGPELIDQADADHLFVSTFGDPEVTQQNAVFTSALWKRLNAVKNNRVTVVSDDTWMTGIGIQDAHLILDDVAKAAGVDPMR